VAAPAPPALRRPRRGRLVRAALGWPALAIGLFFLAAWIGSSLPRNGGWREPAEGIAIMVESNGTHTALVLPLVTAEKDWRPVFPAADLADPAPPYSHVSVSWGDRTVFLDTPTWADLSPATVAHIVVGGGEALLHVGHYVRPAPDADIRPLRLAPAQYRALVRRVEAALAAGEPRRYPGYGASDVFYEARGRYTPARNCNQWTSDTLAAAGVRTGRWTPFAGGVMKWVPPLPG
jgi:uncharacterized protein (TIGR02117 family)